MYFICIELFLVINGGFWVSCASHGMLFIWCFLVILILITKLICKQNKFYPCILVGVLSGDIVIILNLFCKGIPNYVLLFVD